MNVTIQIDVDDALAYLGGSLERLAEACARGLARGTDETASAIVMAAVDQGIESRTGTLLGSVDAWQPGEDPLERQVGVPDESPAERYAYLLTDEVKSITPLGHPYLAIPIGRNLTAAGVARYDSPREIPEGTFETGMSATLPWSDEPFEGLVYGTWSARKRPTRKGGSWSFTPLFALLRGVRVQGRDVLEPTIERRTPAMRDYVAAEIAKALL